MAHAFLKGLQVKRTWEKHLRICSGCKKQIKRAHRWRHVDGKPKHWNCDWPEKVLPAYLHKLVTEELP